MPSSRSVARSARLLRIATCTAVSTSSGLASRSSTSAAISTSTGPRSCGIGISVSDRIRARSVLAIEAAQPVEPSPSTAAIANERSRSVAIVTPVALVALARLRHRVALVALVALARLRHRVALVMAVMGVRIVAARGLLEADPAVGGLARERRIAVEGEGHDGGRSLGCVAGGRRAGRPLRRQLSRAGRAGERDRQREDGESTDGYGCHGCSRLLDDRLVMKSRHGSGDAWPLDLVVVRGSN